MSNNINSLRSIMRFSGLATGLDTDTMVKDLMRVQRMKVDKLFQDRTLLEWKQADYRSMNTLLSKLRDKSFDMRLQSAYKRFNVSSSNDSIVSATATGNASATSYAFNSVTKLASAATMVSGETISQAKAVIKGSPFSAPTFTYPVGEDTLPEHANRFQVRLNGGEWVNVDLPADKTYNSNKDLVNDLQMALNGAGAGAIKVYAATDNRLVFASDNALDTFSLRAVEGSSMLSRLGLNADHLAGVTSRPEKLDHSMSFADLFTQGRLALEPSSFTWLSDISSYLTISEDPGENREFELDVDFATLRTLENPSSISLRLNGRAFSLYTGEDAVPLGQVRLTQGEGGKTTLTFAESEVIQQGAFIELERKEFAVTLSNYNQDGAKVSETFVVNARTDSLNTLLSRINNSRTIGLSAYYDSAADKLSLTSKWKGNNNSAGMDIEFDSFFVNVLKLDPLKGGYTDGQDAEFVLNGLATSRKDNVFTINGVTFTLKQQTAPGQTVSLSVGQDSQSVFNAIEEYVKFYNETLDGINAKLMEQRFPGYPPLTDEQKSAMKDSDIEKWEQKSRSGMLKGDATLQGICDEMRRLLGDPVSGVANDTIKQLSSIGISTGSYYERGRLTLDRTKLMTAIEQDPEGVMELFTKTGSTTGEQGIAARLHASLNSATRRLSERAGSSASLSRVDTSAMGEQIKRLNQRIDSENRRLSNVEERYWRQFTALEKAISQMNSQSAWLAQQFSSPR